LEWNEVFVVEARDGFAHAVVPPGPPCPFCGGAGRREVEIAGVRRVGKCRCQRIIDRIALFNSARIPARHAHCTMESFRRDLDGTQIGWKVTRDWLDAFRPGEENKGLVLEGEPGRGKTHLLCAALREIIFRHGVPARFIEFTHLMSTIKDGIGRGDSDATTLTPLVNVPVLGIDELGKGRKTDFELAIIDEIITRRYNGRGTLLATTNFPSRPPARVRREGDTLAVAGVESLAERLGDRVFSRLRETVQFAPTLGQDYRDRRARA
jgi:DNA replication protein DnaC